MDHTILVFKFPLKSKSKRYNFEQFYEFTSKSDLPNFNENVEPVKKYIGNLRRKTNIRQKIVGILRFAAGVIFAQFVVHKILIQLRIKM